ncbi:MAG TPA: STAS domain-containing protein [bacterium]|jgi:anti-anti-sigma factor|nr:STAS domain-containing protein [bacterium]
MERFSADIVYHNQYPDFITFRIKGDVNIGTVEHIEKNLEPIFAVCQGKKVLFDLTETNYVNSSGWRLFLIAYKRVKELGGRFLLTGMNPDVYNTFELLEFQNFMDYYPDNAEAFRESVKEFAFALPGRPLKEKLAKI